VCCSPSAPFEHKQLYGQIFGQDWTPTDRARVDHLVLFQDFAQTSLKKHRQLSLRTKLLQRFPPTADRHLVYLKRGNTGVLRSIANEDEIIEELSRRGFVILDIRKDSLDVILSHLVSTKLLVSVEGSQSYHGAYSLPHGSGLLLLQPPGRFTATQRGWSENIGVRFGFVVGDPRENSTYFSLIDILKTMDLFFNDPA
jgi:capsular polysaccharide biosynthesis protein